MGILRTSLDVKLLSECSNLLLLVKTSVSLVTLTTLISIVSLPGTAHALLTPALALALDS